MPYLTGRRDGRPHDVLFWRLGRRTAVRLGDWKLVRNPKRGADSDWRLFNLADDIDESDDLAGSRPEKLAEVVRVWERLDGEMAAPIQTSRR